ncbi:transporter substrate-binding domain-containing protein [uncultured Tateyamaria sp.]|uniref:substrate-binding periplasmic protein n=1 Tax=uncultured Tateyamaria sp. TaxID=455651 RepID=UPI002619C3EB|nr:transporter substrate-binding domain-containing protein [uncultured Tateyamaria sp.]
MTRLVFAVLFAFQAVLAPLQAQTLSVVADEWPPFSGEALPNGGLSLDVISAVLRRAGYDVDTQVVPWARVIDGAQTGEFDIVGSLFEDAELQTFLSYSDPFFSTDVRLVQRKGDSHSFTTVDELRPFSIAVGDGFVYEADFDRADYLNKVVVTTTLQGVQMVAHGRVDLTLDSVDVIRHAITHDDPALADRVEFAPGVLVSQTLHMGVRHDLEGSTQIIADFNRVLGEMRDDGSLDALLAVHASRLIPE